jgi:hypothetical protein
MRLGSNGNVRFNAQGNANVVTISNGNLSVGGNIIAIGSGNFAVTGNTSYANGYYFGNGSFLTGITLTNGNSNVVVYANSNVTVSVGGNSNTAIFTNNTFITNTNIFATGNITANGSINLGNNAGNIFTITPVGATAPGGTASLYHTIYTGTNYPEIRISANRATIGQTDANGLITSGTSALRINGGQNDVFLTPLTGAGVSQANIVVNGAGGGGFTVNSGNLAVINNTFLGGAQVTGPNPVPLQVINTGASGTYTTGINMFTGAGSQGAGIGIDFFTYTNANIPGARLAAIDDGNFGANVVLSTKQSGSSNNALQTRMAFNNSGVQFYNGGFAVPLGTQTLALFANNQSVSTATNWPVYFPTSATGGGFPASAVTPSTIGLTTATAASAGTKFTNTSGSTRVYRVDYSLSFSTNNTGGRVFWIQYNGTSNQRFAYFNTNATNGDITKYSGSSIITMANNEYFQVYAYQTSGSALTMGGPNGGGQINNMMDFVTVTILG